MIEYRGGFGEPGPLPGVIDQLKHEVEAGLPVKALHIGTPAELTRIKEEANIKQRLAALEAAVEDLRPQHSDLLHLPTPEEIKAVCGD